jgi:serine/threonine protein phosphatase PrpC
MVSRLRQALLKITMQVSGLTEEATSLRQRLEAMEKAASGSVPRKSAEVVSKPPSTAVEAGARHINEMWGSGATLAAVVSDKGEIPHKNDDFGVAFSNGRLVSACVCDGVSSAKNGGDCAELAARSFLVFSRSAAHGSQESLDTHELVRVSFDRALKAVAARGFHESTMIAAVMDALTWKLSLGWMGDGGALLISNKGVREILRQHRNEFGEITRFISGDGHGGDEPEIEDISLQPSDVVLLASDGFADFELDHKILCSSVLGALESGISAEQVCAKLVCDAMSAGADDNVTVALIGLCGPVSALNGHEPPDSRNAENLSDQPVNRGEERLVQVRGKAAVDGEVKQVPRICAS